MDKEFIRQLRRLAIERRPEACLGCGFEHGCSTHGCTVIKKAIETIKTLNDFDKSQGKKLLERISVLEEQLAANEQAEKDGLIVRLPCKVGDAVYLSDGKEVFEMQVGSLFPAGFIVKARLCNAFLVDKYTYKCVVFSDFNKTVFLTREAAEAALKEQEGNDGK